jgi:type 1 fimbriae regulatory protein FimB/type 1 fimbriae regulatory protein FimE
MDNQTISVEVPSTLNRTVPLRRPNSDLRSREYLTIAEVTALAEAAKHNRQGQRDSTMILIAFRHGLRATELVSLKWDAVSFDNATLHVRRVKQGNASVHPLSGMELRALRALKRASPASPFLFVSERAAPLSTAGFARMLERCADAAGLSGLRVHPHMLRHACGFALANAGHDTRAIQAYLGHRNIQHTVRYTELSPERFKEFWQD